MNHRKGTPHLRHHPEIIPGKFLFPVQLIGYRCQFLTGEVPYRGLEHLMLFTKRKVHRFLHLKAIATADTRQIVNLTPLIVKE